MRLALMLTPERETRYQEQARQAGLPLEEYALRVLDGATETPPEAPRTGADLLAQWGREGALLPAEGAPDSPTYARQVREQAQRRQ